MKQNNDAHAIYDSLIGDDQNREHVGLNNIINEKEDCSLCNLYIPIELNLITLLNKYGYKEWTTKIRLNKLYYLLSQISEAMLVQDIDENKGYVSLNIQRLESIICKAFPSKGLGVLERIGVIKINQSYNTNRISKGYKFAKKYRLGIKCIEIFDKKISRKLKNTKERRILNTISKSKNYKFLFNCLELVTFKEGTYRFLKEKIYDPQKADQEKRWEIGYNKIKTKDWFFIHDPKSGRLFNNIANLPRDLRSFLLLDKQELVEIDISNCQPLLLYSLYDDRKSEESLRYKKMVESGKFYEDLNNFAENPLDFEIEENRGIFKKAIYKQILFCRNWYKNKPLWAVFQNEFPILASKIIEAKKGDYRKLARKLQKLEADIIIGGVVDRIRKTLPKLKILTVHDSVLCHSRHAQLVEEIIKESVFEKIGVVPKITRKEHKIPTVA